MTWTPTTMGPSRAQLSALQILPADLPSFNGNPDEWPTFTSAFVNSTSVAGFSNVENMLRLQKCQAFVTNHVSRSYKHIKNVLWSSRSNSG